MDPPTLAESQVRELREIPPRARPQSAGSSTLKPTPPQAWAKAAKSMGCRSTPYSGLPRKTICSHLICPSVLFLMITTLIGQLVFHGGNEIGHEHRESAIADERNALPIRDKRSARRSCRASPGAIVARFPESEYIWPRRAGIWRAHQVVMVPLSQLTIASSRKRFPSSHATTCGFIGLSLASGALFHQLPPVLHSGLRRFEKLSVFLALQ